MKKALKTLIFILILSLALGLILKIFSINTNTNSAKINLKPNTKISPNPKNTITITLTNNGFEPQEVTIPTNTKIIWVNESENTATVDSNPHPLHTDHPELNIGEFKSGKKLNFIFTQPGNYNYHNHYNPNNTGTIFVK